MSFDERGAALLRRAPGGDRGRPERTEDAVAPSAEGTDRSEQTAARRRGSTIALGLLLPVALLAIWWVAAEFTDVPDFLLPSPAQVVAAGVELASDGLLAPYVLISLQRVLIGFAIGATIGLSLGALVGLSTLASRLLGPILGAIRAVPSLAWVPLLLIYLGIYEEPKLTLIAIGAAFPVFTTVAGALRHVDPHLVEVGRAYGLGRTRLLVTVQLPAVVPAIVSGLRLALAQAWLFLVAAELISSSMGLGFLLTDSQNNGRMDRIYLAIILLAVLGKSTDALVGIGEHALLKRWG